MNKSKIILVAKFIVPFIAVFFMGTTCFAGDPNDPTEGGNLGGEASTPIDGGLGILVAAGVAYGVKKYHNSRKEKLANKGTI